MSWKAFALGLGALVALWSAAVVFVSQQSAAPLRIFVAYQGPESYRVEAHEFRIEGFCTVFIKNGQRFAAVCGQHTVSEAIEVQ